MIESSRRPRNVVVVGAGHMGTIHARRILSSPLLKLVGIVDPDEDRGSDLARSVGTTWAPSPESILESTDAAIVAVPTTRHAEVALPLLEAGIDLLIEKPLTATLEESRLIANKGESLGRVVHVGHVEWFNPVLRSASSRIRLPLRFQSQREGFLRHSTADVDVVWDLMMHDLHILLSLMNGEIPSIIKVEGDRVVSETCDRAEVHLQFSSGCIATLCANRASDQRLRRIKIEEENETLDLDLLSHTLSVEGRQQGKAMSIDVPVTDAISAEHEAFARAIRGETHHGVTAMDVLPTLELASKISSALLTTPSMKLAADR